jgi:hypothetical protein
LCARTIERRRSIGFAVTLAGSSLVLASLMALVVTPPRQLDYVVDASRVRALRERVEASRGALCTRTWQRGPRSPRGVAGRPCAGGCAPTSLVEPTGDDPAVEDDEGTTTSTDTYPPR